MISLMIRKAKAPLNQFFSISRMFLSYILLILISSAALAVQDETYGIVTNVVNGDTFDVMIQKADPRISYSVERIRLADVNSPEMDTAQGPAARDFTFAVLMNKRVYLDIDDKSGNGRDEYGRLISVAYLAGFYGQPLVMPCFNRMLVDSRQAVLKNFTDNEFNPTNWWSEENSWSIDDPTQNLQNELITKIQDSAENEFDRVANENWDWLKGQIAIRADSILKS